MTDSLSKDLGNAVLRTVAGGWRYSDEVYLSRWIARVKARCVIDARTGCWLWQGFIHPRGYGQTHFRGRGNVHIHRAMYMAVHGVSLAFEQQVCHSCDVRRCCNPDHLWLGTNKDNHRDKNAKGRNYFANQTHCWRGHEFTPENTRRYESRPGVISRSCVTCERIRMASPEYKAWAREYQRKRRAMKRAKRPR